MKYDCLGECIFSWEELFMVILIEVLIIWIEVKLCDSDDDFWLGCWNVNNVIMDCFFLENIYG